MSITFIKRVGIAVVAIVGFYTMQYFATSVHHACKLPEEDCPPPFYLIGEFFYNTVVQPPWVTSLIADIQSYE